MRRRRQYENGHFCYESANLYALSMATTVEICKIIIAFIIYLFAKIKQYMQYAVNRLYLGGP